MKSREKGESFVENTESGIRGTGDYVLFAPHQVCIVADVHEQHDALSHSALSHDALSHSALSLLGQLRESGSAAKVLAVPQGQTPAHLRTLPYIASQLHPIVNVRYMHAPMVIDPLLFRGGMAPLQGIWSSLQQPGLSELLVECVKHEARVYVATCWSHLIAAAVAAAYHDAVLLFMPDASELTKRPVQGDGNDLIAVLHQQLVPLAVQGVFAPVASQVDEYRTIFGDRVMDVDSLAGETHLQERRPSDDTEALASRTQAIAKVVREAAAGLVRRNYSDEHNEAGATLAAIQAESHPLLSVSVPTYNRAPLLIHTLSSVCAQAERYGLEDLIEIVVSDNDSSDQTQEMLMQFAQHTRVRVRHHRNARNMGVGFNVMNTLELAHGEFCCVLGDDDFLVEGTLPRLLHALLAPTEVALVIFRASGAAFQYATPTRISMQDVSRDWFYHIGNLGLAMVRREHCSRALTSRDRDALQRFWPQTQTYFHAMLEAGVELPALAVPDVVVFHPLHRVLTAYSGRYLWDEGFFSLFDVAMRLQPEMPEWFMSTIVNHYFLPRGDAIASAMIDEYADVDSPLQKEAAVNAMCGSLRLAFGWRERLGPDAGRVLERITSAMLRYAKPASASDYTELVGMLNAVVTEDVTSASVSAASHSS